MQTYTGTKADKAYNDKLNRVKEILKGIPEYSSLDDRMIAAIYAEGNVFEISGCVGLERSPKKEITSIRVLGNSNGEYLVECNGRIGFTSQEKIYAALGIERTEKSSTIIQSTMDGNEKTGTEDR